LKISQIEKKSPTPLTIWEKKSERLKREAIGIKKFLKKHQGKRIHQRILLRRRRHDSLWRSEVQFNQEKSLSGEKRFAKRRHKGYGEKVKDTVRKKVCTYLINCIEANKGVYMKKEKR